MHPNENDETVSAGMQTDRRHIRTKPEEPQAPACELTRDIPGAQTGRVPPGPAGGILRFRNGLY